VALRLAVELARRCPPEQLPTALSSAGTSPPFFLCSSLSRPSPHSFPLFLSFLPFLLSCPHLSLPYYSLITSGQVHIRLPRQPQAHALRPRRRRTRRPGGRRRARPRHQAGPGQRARAARRGMLGGRMPIFGPYLSPYLCPYLSSSRPLSVLLSVAAWPWQRARAARRGTLMGCWRVCLANLCLDPDLVGCFRAALVCACAAPSSNVTTLVCSLLTSTHITPTLLW